MILSASHAIMNKKPDGKGRYTPMECFLAMQKAGYDAVDISWWTLSSPEHDFSGENWERVVDDFIAASEATGLPVNQTHANVLGGEQWDDPKTDMAAYTESVYRSIEASRRVGAAYTVLHPFNLAHAPLYNREKNREACIRFLAPYIEMGRKAGVGIAVENMVDFRRQRRRYCAGDIYELIELVDAINDPMVGICFDTGHANIDGVTPAAAIREIGKRLVCTHINDNNKSKPEDAHLLPYFGNINWTDVMHALKEIGYNRDFSYEIGSQKVPTVYRDAWLKYTVDIGRKLLAIE